ncbi:MAG TPA: tail fiber domain-containing protein [Bacteroidales bacterium]|nr:tail fiber domain-containing protein [Bacteroidales bacterium]
MKKLFVLIVLAIMATTVFAQINVNSSGNVGIKTASPSYTLDVNGSARIRCSTGAYNNLIFEEITVSGGYSHPTIRPSSDWYGSLGTSSYRFGLLYCDHVIARDLEETSDERIKENIKDLDGSLDKILKLRGIRYDMKPDYFNVADEKYKSKLEEEGKNQIGFLAQELGKVFPEAVSFDSTSNLYSVRYTRLVPVLVEAMKEQQAEIEILKEQLAYIEENCCGNNLKSASLGSEANFQSDEIKAQLSQNVPNPFNQTTKINCTIPSESGSANLYIYNMQGIQLQHHKINGTGEQCVVVSAESLNPGIYLYSLVIDGKEIDTKKMMLTE